MAREGSFTRAATRPGVTQSALSHAMNGLAARLGRHLLKPLHAQPLAAEAGERLLRIVAPQCEPIGVELRALTEMPHRPDGRIRITAPEHAAETVLWQVLRHLLPAYPEITVEIETSQART